jgi:nitronate monooxygenase
MIGAMLLPTRLTERLGLRHPVVLAPMAFAAAGHLAAAVCHAGGLGLIGGGYGDRAWIDARLDEAAGRMWVAGNAESAVAAVCRGRP